MAAIRFQTTVFSYNSWSYFIQIWDRNYTGSTITEITLGQGGPQINWDSDNDDRFSTIMSSSCDIPLIVEGTLLENWLKSVRDSYEEKDVYVHIYRNTQATASSLIWSGFLLMDLNSTVDEFFPYEFKLTFTDGLSLLKEVDFVETGATKPYDSSEMLWGPASYSFWMKTVLGKVGAALTTEGAITDWEWRTSINWYNTGHGASAPSTLTFDPFAKTEVQVSMFHNEETEGVYEPRNCYDVLNELLKHWGARIVYWRHKFWIIQIPEYNTAETGTLANPDNINTRKYFHSSNSVSDAFDNLNDYWTPYQVFLQASGVIGPSKIVGTKYDFKAPIKEVIAKYITGSGENYFGGFPTSENTVVTQERINNLADASGIYLDIPLIFTQNRANVNSGLTGGQFSSFAALIYYQLAATNLAHGGSTTLFLHYNSSNNSYFWNANPPSTTRPYWYASNLSFQSGSTGVMTQQLGGPDNGAAVLIPTDPLLTGVFDITIQIFNFVNGVASNKYAFIDNDSFANWADPTDIGLSWENVASVSGTTISSSSYVSGSISIVTYYQGNGNPFAGQLLPLSTNNQIAATAQNIIQNSNNTNNSSIRNFNELLWGDSPASVSRGALEVVDTSGTRTTTVTSGQWGVGVTNGTQTFSKLLLDRFLEGQLTSIRVANFRLVIPTDAKDKDDGTAVRPQYINPVGLLVENRPQEAPMSYVMQRGTFHVLRDEWDFQGFEIQSESTSASTVTVTDTNFGTIDIPVSTAPPSFLQRPPSSSINSAARNNIITTLTTAVNGLGSDLVANGNYDELGSELVTNGDFATDSDWAKGTGWTISGGVASFNTTTNGNINQSGYATNKTYKVSIDVVSYVRGNPFIAIGQGSQFPIPTSVGTHIIYVNSGSTDTILRIYSGQFGAGGEGSIDNVSVKQVDPDDDWTKGTGWTIQDDQAQFSGSADAALEQAGVFTEGTKYKVSIDVAEISGGELEVKDQTTIHQAITSAGGYEFTFTAANTALQLNANTGSVERTIKINSITAQEVSSTTSLAINSIGEAIFATGDKFSLLNINNNTTYDLTINANQSASDTTLTITSFDFEAIVPVGSIVTFNKKNLIKQYQDDTLQEVTDNGNTTTNSIMIGSSSAPISTLHLKSTASPGPIIQLESTANFGADNFIRYGDSNENYSFALGADDSSNTFRLAYNGSSFDGAVLGTNDLLVITSSGNVGIGTTSPETKLQVGTGSGASVDSSYALAIDGSGITGIQILSGSTQSGRIVFGDSDNASVGMLRYDHSDNSMRYRVNGSEKMRLTSDGNLLIGTTSDSGQKLVVDGTAKVEQYFYINDTGNSNLFFIRNESNFASIDNGTRTLNFIGGDKIFLNGSFAEAMRIKSGGNVLIGTTSDSGFKLRVNGDSTNGVVAIKNASNGRDTMRSENASGTRTFNIGNDGSGNGIVLIRNSSGTTKTYLSGNGDSYLNAGNVGIGQTSPAHKLDVAGYIRSANTGADSNTKYSQFLGRHYTNSEQDVLAISTESTSSNNNIYVGGGFSSRNSATTIRFSTASNNTTTTGSERMRITSDGSVGIGTTSPSTKLEVSGHVRLSSNGLRLEFTNANVGLLRDSNNLVLGGYDNIIFRSENSGITSQSERMRINSSGNVGIGLTNPSEKLSLPDNSKIGLGDSADLQIYHDGSNSFIDDAGTGKLRIRSNLLHLEKYTGENMAIFSADGAVSIYYDGSKKLETSSDGVDIKGTCTSELLQLKRQESTPSEPNEDRSIIYMDAEGDIKVMINVGGTVVTRTLATFG